MSKKGNILLLILFLALSAQAQVMMQFNPVTDGLNVNRLANISLNNRYPFGVECRLVITIKEAKLGTLLKVSTPPFALQTGFNVLPADAFNRSAFTFADNAAGYALAQTRNFADGDYEYCFEANLKGLKGAQVTTDYIENCFTQVLERNMPMVLVNPYDKEKSCNKRPNFLWQPSIPIQPFITYTFILAEIKPGQLKSEAIAYNQPVVLQTAVRGNMLNYPAIAPALEEGKNYAWQVLATNNKMIVTRSEIWEYKVTCGTEEKKTETDSYRELKESRDEGVYLASRWLRFVFYNPYGPAPVNYAITNLTEKEKPLKRVPELKMQGGFNKYELDLQGIKGLINQNQYLLTVTMNNGKKLYLNFIYKGEGNDD